MSLISLTTMFSLSSIVNQLGQRTPFTQKELQTIILPLINYIIKQKKSQKPLLIGIQGGQGTGKTTLSNLLTSILSTLQYKTISFSLDDFYFSAQERRKISQKYPHNPFYQIPRGMPGTHNVKELSKTLNNIKAGRPFTIPVFDKSKHQGYGDILPKKQFITQPQDIIIVEGWCVGLPKTTVSELTKICRKHHILLKTIDPNLKSTLQLIKNIPLYIKLWKYLDFIIMMLPNSPQLHLKWRWQQEQELIKHKRRGQAYNQIKQFVNVYLPLTYLCYDKIKPDLKIFVNNKHRMYKFILQH